jgi:hypothetical protein
LLDDVDGSVERSIFRSEFDGNYLPAEWQAPPAVTRKESPVFHKLSLMIGWFAVLVAVPAVATAALQVGDDIRFNDLNGSPGGEFGVAKLSDPSTQLFVTFCIERNEYLDFSGDGFNVDSISTAAENGGLGGGSPDPLSDYTAWLYYQFATGGLADDGYDSSVTEANLLQNAIWKLEDEPSNIAGAPLFVSIDPDATYYNLALTSSTPAERALAADRVRVVNISWLTSRSGRMAGDLGQSVLMVIPEATTIVVWSVLGLIGMYGQRRRRLD